MYNIIKVELSPGELIDKITILEIKLERITEMTKITNIRTELSLLTKVFTTKIKVSNKLTSLTLKLKSINEKLWVIEDQIRECERKNDFGQNFIDLARSVYFTNDERSATKREINQLLGSNIVEEKSYSEY